MRIERTISIIVGAIVLLAGGAWAADFEIPLDLRPGGGKGGLPVISNGVPLIAGQAMKTDELHVIGPDGKEVPAQFRVLARWRRVDKSIRWVLVTFVRSEREGDKPIYKLVGRKAGAPRPKTALKMTQDDKFIRIDTGAAQFEISKTKFNLLNRVTIGAATVVKADPKLGSVVEDVQGRKYYSSKGTTSVKVLEAGPVMVKVRAQGIHVSDEEGAFKPGLYGYEVFMTFHADQSYCNIDAILTNNSAEPIGEPHFEDWSLLTRIENAPGRWSMYRPGTGPGGGGVLKGQAGGEGESALIYQDSVGTEHWKTNVGVKTHGGKNAVNPDLASYRGYKVWRLSGGKKKAEGAGDFSQGIIQCGMLGGGQNGCTVSPRHFWQQFPSAVGFGGDGVVRLSPFPREYKGVHWLEDGSAKGQEFLLYFHSVKPLPPGEALAPEHRPGPKTLSPMETAKRYQTRIFALPSPEHCGKAGALADLGPYMNHPKIANAVAKRFSLAKVKREALTTNRNRGDGNGWQVFGMTWTERAGVSGTNYEPLGSSSSLWSHLVSGRDDFLQWGIRLSRHYRDVRTYHVEGRDNLALWKDWRSYTTTCVLEHYSRLVKGPTSRGKPIWEIYKHPYKRKRWPLPNMQHLNLDEVYDLYCLTGDDRALRCMKTIADHGMAWVALIYRPLQVNRDVGWCLRSLARYYDITGEKPYEVALGKCMDRVWREVNKAGVWTMGFGGFYTAVYARGMANAYFATGDERMRDLAIGAADWEIAYGQTPKGHPFPAKRVAPWTLTPEDRMAPDGQRGMCPAYGNRHHIALYALAYRFTGEAKYREAFEFAWKVNRNTWQGFYPSCMYMVYGKRADTVAPAAVKDLAAKVDGANVTLTWTASGDDGAKGRSAIYQVKYSTKPILEFVPFPEKMDTHVTFWGSENADGEPAPAAAGEAESFTVKGLAAGTYYFALKSRDECDNQSPISNVVTVNVKEGG